MTSTPVGLCLCQSVVRNGEMTSTPVGLCLCQSVVFLYLFYKHVQMELDRSLAHNWSICNCHLDNKDLRSSQMHSVRWRKGVSGKRQTPQTQL